MGEAGLGAAMHGCTADLLARLAGALDVTQNLHVAVDGVNALTFGERVA